MKINIIGILNNAFICVMTAGSIFVFSSASHASGLSTVNYNYINDLIGGRASGMAGAYTAISDDPAGTYYNPAGIVFALDNQISLSVNSYRQKNIEFKKVIGNNSYTQDISSFYPSFFGVVQSFGPIKLAVTFISKNNEILEQGEHYTNVYARADDGNTYPSTFDFNYNITDNTILGGLSAATFITDSITAGFTLYGTRRHNVEILSQKIIFHKAADDTPFLFDNLYKTETMYGVIGKLGIQWMPSTMFSFGASIAVGTILSHDMNATRFTKTDSQTNLDDPIIAHRPLNIILKSSYDDSALPLECRLGAAWFPSKSLIISADFIAHLGDKYYQDSVQNTYNGAVGVEYFITRSFPVRAGFFTNFANTPPIDKNYTNQQMHVDMYGFSLNLGWQTKNSAISLGGFYQIGTGEAQVFPNSKSVQETVVRSFIIALTGSAKY